MLGEPETTVTHRTGNIRAVSSPEPTPSAYRYSSELAGDIERRWQDRWESEGTFDAPNPTGDLAGDVTGEKFFIMDMFPYPSGAGLHVGHPLGYIATDVIGRYRRMQVDRHGDKCTHIRLGQSQPPQIKHIWEDILLHQSLSRESLRKQLP